MGSEHFFQLADPSNSPGNRECFKKRVLFVLKGSVNRFGKEHSKLPLMMVLGEDALNGRKGNCKDKNIKRHKLFLVDRLCRVEVVGSDNGRCSWGQTPDFWNCFKEMPSVFKMVPKNRVSVSL